MKINSISSTPSFGMARMTKNVQRFISAAQKNCPQEQQEVLSAAIDVLKTGLKDKSLVKTKGHFYLLPKKPEYIYNMPLSVIKGDSVNDIRFAAFAIEWRDLASKTPQQKNDLAKRWLSFMQTDYYHALIPIKK